MNIANDEFADTEQIPAYVAAWTALPPEMAVLLRHVRSLVRHALAYTDQQILGEEHENESVATRSQRRVDMQGSSRPSHRSHTQLKG